MCGISHCWEIFKLQSKLNFLANVYGNVCWQQQEGCDPLLFFWTFRFHSSFHALEMQQLALNWRREKKLIWCQIRSSIIFWIAAAPTWFCKNFYTMTRRKYYGSYVTRSIFEGLKYNQSKLMSRLSGSMDIQYLFQMKIIKKFLLEILPQKK